MNQEIKAKWVAALRSGEYKQGEGQLRSGDKFCCLGVLCNLHAQAHPEVAATQSDPELYMGERFLPPATVRAWAGFAFADGPNGPYLRLGHRTDHLPVLNDQDLNFKQIADLIEAQL